MCSFYFNTAKCFTIYMNALTQMMVDITFYARLKSSFQLYWQEPPQKWDQVIALLCYNHGHTVFCTNSYNNTRPVPFIQFVIYKYSFKSKLLVIEWSVDLYEKQLQMSSKWWGKACVQAKVQASNYVNTNAMCFNLYLKIYEYAKYLQFCTLKLN